MSKEYPCVYYDNEKCKKYSTDGVTSYCVMGPCSHETPSNADRIRAMSDEELAELLGGFGPCEKCGFSVGWRCQPDRQDYSDSEKCVEGRKRWLKQPAEGEQLEYSDL